MHETVAYSTLALTVALAISRPRVGVRDLRFTPGTAALLGVALLSLSGLLTFHDMVTSAVIQWRPLLALTCIMVMTGVVHELGAFDRVAHRIEAYARQTSPTRAFGVVFFASVITPSLLNNDSAILLLTPIVVALTRRLYPGNKELTVVFAFAIFLAPGVAPFVISNPMNMVVAEYAGIGFNAYARVMLPISVVGAVFTFAILRLHFRQCLAAAVTTQTFTEIPTPHAGERAAIDVLLAVFGAYPVIAVFDGPMWAVSLCGAAACLLLAWRYRVATPQKLARHVSPDILVFLWGVFLVVVGLRHVGVVDSLSTVYRSTPKGTFHEIGVVGGIAALGSALVDNHPMSVLNMMALGARGGSRTLLAALVGGDIGPRLLPIGSLAGILWMDLLRKAEVKIPISQFVRLGTLVLVPTLTISLVMLWILSPP